MSDQNLVWSDILAIEIIRTRLNVWQFLDWSDILPDHFRKVIIPTDPLMYSSSLSAIQYFIVFGNISVKRCIHIDEL